MVNRTGTYIAFDGLGQKDPKKSDFRYYAIIEAWNASKHAEFSFTNSHDKANAVRDRSKLSTLQASIKKRLLSSKNMLIVLSDDTRKSGSVLSWEIEKAVDDYHLPLIIAYTKKQSKKFSNRWPTTLAERLDNKTAKAMHVHFKQNDIFDAIQRFTVNSEILNGSFNYK